MENARPEKEKKYQGSVYLTVRDVSETLKCSRAWIFKLVNQGRIPFYRPGGKAIRFRGDEIDQWLLQSKGRTYHRDKLKETVKTAVLGD